MDRSKKLKKLRQEMHDTNVIARALAYELIIIEEIGDSPASSFEEISAQLDNARELRASLNKYMDTIEAMADQLDPQPEPYDESAGELPDAFDGDDEHEPAEVEKWTAEIEFNDARAKTIVVIARRWLDEHAGNTYHSVRIIADGEHVATVSKTHGYGLQYETTARDKLIELDLVEKDGSRPLSRLCDNQGIALLFDVIDVNDESELHEEAN